MKAVRRILATVTIAVAMLAAPTAAAAAEQPATTTATVAVAHAAPQLDTAGGVSPRPDIGAGEYSDWSRYLPSERWSGATQTFHGRFDQFLQNDVISWSHRKITQQIGMTTGNFGYNLSQGLLIFGLEMQPLNLLGAEADQVAATIGVSLYENSPVVLAILVVIIFSVVWRMARTGARPWKRIGTAAGIVALLAVMTTGAQASTVDGNGDYRPGLGSPGWFATAISDSISTIALVPAQALAIESPVMTSSTPDGSGCKPYMDALEKRVSANGPSATVPRLVSELWESSGLAVFKQVQYGTVAYTDAGLTYGDHVFCHQLEWQANAPVRSQAALMFGSVKAAEAAGYNPKSPAWGAPDNDQRDRSMVAWAACAVSQNGTISVREGFRTTSDGQPWITVADCDTWWTAGSADVDLGAFNIGGKASDVLEKTDDPAVQNFLLTLHGNDTGPGLVLTWGYGLSSVLMLLVFGSFGLAIAVAKFAGVVMIISLFFVMLMSLLARDDMGGRIANFVKMYLGFTVFAFAATLILAMLTVISRMVSGTGASVFGPGAFMSLVLTGLSPVIAAVLLHLLFTRLFKAPSIFKPSSAMAWGSMFGAVGGVAGSGFTQQMENRASRISRTAGVRARRAATDYALGRVRGAGGAAAAARAGGMAATAGGRSTAAGFAGAAAARAAGASPAAGVGAALAGSRVGMSAASGAGSFLGAAGLGAVAGFAAARLARRNAPAADAAPVEAPDTHEQQPAEETKGKVRVARQKVAYLASAAFRQNARAHGAQMVEAARGRVAAVQRRSAALADWTRTDPVGAAGYLAEGAAAKGTAAAKIAARAASTVATRGGKAAVAAGRRAAPVAGQMLINSGRVALGATIGAVAAGPVGGIGGALIGGQRIVAAEKRAEIRDRLAAEQATAAAKAAEDAKRAQAKAVKEAAAEAKAQAAAARDAAKAAPQA